MGRTGSVIVLLLIVTVLTAGCGGTISSHISFTSSFEETFTVNVYNDTSYEVLVNAGGHLFPVLGPGEESGDQRLHLFDLPGFYFALASPEGEFDMYEETSDLKPAGGGRYTLRLISLTPSPDGTILEYRLDML